MFLAVNKLLIFTLDFNNSNILFYRSCSNRIFIIDYLVISDNPDTGNFVISVYLNLF